MPNSIRPCRGIEKNLNIPASESVQTVKAKWANPSIYTHLAIPSGKINRVGEDQRKITIK